MVRMASDCLLHAKICFVFGVPEDLSIASLCTGSKDFILLIATPRNYIVDLPQFCKCRMHKLYHIKGQVNSRFICDLD